MSFVPSQMNPRLAKMNKNKGRNVPHGKTEKIRRTTAGSVDAMRDHSSTKKQYGKGDKYNSFGRGDDPRENSF